MKEQKQEEQKETETTIDLNHCWICRRTPEEADRDLKKLIVMMGEDDLDKRTQRRRISWIP